MTGFKFFDLADPNAVQAKEILLEESTVCEVHSLISGLNTELGRVLDVSLQALANGPVSWSIPVTPRTVHSIVTTHLFASNHGISVRLQPAIGLSAQEEIFHQDFLARGLPLGKSMARRFKLAIRENCLFLQDLFRIAAKPKSLASKPVLLTENGFKAALLIGQYGGEHVGDTAILGGVLMRLHRDYGTTQAHLLSHRPDHTQSLLEGLQAPVSVAVHQSGYRQAEDLLDQVQALVFAGGPIMDLPRVLARQMAVSCSARSRALPIVIDRVGVGPFKRQSSRRAARQIFRSASSLSVRTTGAAKDPTVADLSPQILEDPAFEYLGTRIDLASLSKRDTADVARLIIDTEGRFRIGINLRPIRHYWSPQGEDYSRMVAEQFIDRFSQGLIAFAEQVPTPPCYVFFSMNPQEFGMSDLRIAYQLHCRLGMEVDFRVWEGDPDVDGVLHLLRQLDSVIAMRFHACIFAISQSLPNLGLDYYPGQGGKVEQLFADAKRPEDACRIDQFEVSWLLQSLTRLTPQMSARMNNRDGVT